MKKAFLVLTIFLSSFFLIFSRKVSARVYDVSLDFSLIPGNFSSIIEKFNDYIVPISSYTGNYFIASNASTAYVFRTSGSYTMSFSATSISIFGNGCDTLSIDNSDTVQLISANSTCNIEVYSTINGYGLLYSTFDLSLINKHTINYSYNDFSYTDSPQTTNKMTSLYDLYTLYSPQASTPTPIDTFYTVIIAKIILLGNDFATNPILLTLLVILILIFLFELIFRRKL